MHPFQYTYDLFVESISGGGYDANRNPIQTTSNMAPVSKCREEANNKGQKVDLVDGNFYYFDFVVQLPKSCPIISEGTYVEIREGATVRAKGTVKRFKADKFHSRLWL